MAPDDRTPSRPGTPATTRPAPAAPAAPPAPASPETDPASHARERPRTRSVAEAAAARQSPNDYPAIDLPADRPYDRIREYYLYLEPSLLAAIARRDRREAVRVINHVLLHIYAAGAERNDVLKGLLLELVVMMSRAAIAAGSPASRILGLTARTIDELATISSDEGFATWLRRLLDGIMDAVERTGESAPSTTIAAALGHIREHAGRELTRDETARAVGVSPSHFSHLLRERTGLSFTALLRQARIELACELLLNTDHPIADIAQRCGFYDQSHLTKVFARSRRVTPRQFREQSRAPHGRILLAPPA